MANLGTGRSFSPVSLNCLFILLLEVLTEFYYKMINQSTKRFTINKPIIFFKKYLGNKNSVLKG